MPSGWVASSAPRQIGWPRNTSHAGNDDSILPVGTRKASGHSTNLHTTHASTFRTTDQLPYRASCNLSEFVGLGCGRRWSRARLPVWTVLADKSYQNTVATLTLSKRWLSSVSGWTQPDHGFCSRLLKEGWLEGARALLVVDAGL